jgi:hypothetical protein
MATSNSRNATAPSHGESSTSAVASISQLMPKSSQVVRPGSDPLPGHAALTDGQASRPAPISTIGKNW